MLQLIVSAAQEVTMSARRISRDDSPVLPTPELMAHAKDVLSHLDDGQHRFVLWDRVHPEIKLDEEIFDLMRRILIDLSQNRAIQILPHDMELTTIQAAEFLQVSRPHLVKLIQAGKLPCRLVGTHRRIKLIDLMAYRRETDAVSAAAREQMTKDAEANGWGY
jgi:excisionase family DNA binding protein